MIPTIEDIVRGLLANSMTEEKALAWLYQHMENSDLRDQYAGMAMQAAATNPDGADGFTFNQRAEWAYMQADAMIEERSK